MASENSMCQRDMPTDFSLAIGSNGKTQIESDTIENGNYIVTEAP
jgi:hypothetical protein